MDGKCILCGASLPEGEFHKVYDCYEYTKKINDELVKAIEPAIEWLTKWEAGDWTHQYKYGVEVLEGLKAALDGVE